MTFDPFDRDFDRSWRRTGCLAWGLGGVILLVTVAWIAVVVWAVVRLVEWVTTK